MKAPKILMVFAAFVVIAGLTTDAWAQCPSARQFSSAGWDGMNVRLTITHVEDGGNAIGRFWDSDDWTLGHNGVFNDAGSECEGQELGCLCPPINDDPASSWWVDHVVPGEKKITGWMTNLACVQTGCPSNLTVVVEDFAAAGPPGWGDTAYYTAWMVDETREARWWDFARVDGLDVATTLPMLPFPDLMITASYRVGGAVGIIYRSLDQTGSVHTWNNGTGAVFPTTSVISEWQLVVFTGQADPGRRRDLGWTTIQRIPYVPGGTTGNYFTVPCTAVLDDEFIAIGIGFNGGGGAVIDSALVGRAVQIECDPYLAEPEDVNTPTDRKRSAQELQATPGRSGGRR